MVCSGIDTKGESMKNKGKNLRVIIVVVVLCITGIIAIALDEYLNLETRIFKNLVEIMFNFMATVVGIWATCYFLFIQIYKDSYPLKFVNKDYLPKLKEYFVYSVVLFFYGAVVITRNNGWIENIYFAIISFALIICIIIHTFKSSRSLMVNTYIDNFCGEIKKGLEKSEAIIDEQLLENIRRVLDESLVKEEYYVVQNITQKLGDVFREFLSKSIEMIGNGNTAEEVEKNYNEILKIYIFELEMCSKINSDLVVDDIIDQNIKNINFLIDSKQFEWFKKYVVKVNILNIKLQKAENNKDTTVLNYIYIRVLKKLIEKEYDNWLKYLIDEIFDVTKSLNFMYENTNLKNFTNILTSSILYALDEKKSDIYDKLFIVFKQFTIMLCKIPKGFSDVLVYYALLYNDLKKNDKDKMEEFITCIFESTKMMTDDPKFLEFKYYCISETEVNCSEQIKRKLREYHIDTLLSTIELKDKYRGYWYIPEYEREIIELQYEPQKIKNICEDIETLIYKCIICDNEYAYYNLLDIVGRCLNKTESKDKDIQCKLFDIYITFVNVTVNLKNRRYIEILFQKIKDELRELDKISNVSDDFSKYIIEKLIDCAKYIRKENNYVILYVVDMIFELLQEGNEIQFINRDIKKKHFLYQNLYNIGTGCIENDFEEGIRKVSNVLGWFIIYNIKQGVSELVIYLIERAKELYTISNNMEVSAKTQIFILTLFTTVGTFCCKDNKNGIYLQKVLECIKNENDEKIKTAIKLRTSENTMWNDLFNNQTEQLTKKFMKQLEIKKNVKK